MNKSKFEKGQTLVFVVIGFFAFIAMLALVLDGGNAYAAKRQAQNAVDAAALAGATAMCKNNDEALGRSTAISYAITNGGDNTPIVRANLSSATVIVTDTVTKDTFFAGLIGYPQVSPRAVAKAACQTPIGVGTLPVAWSCRAPTGSLPGKDCVQKTIDYCGGLPYTQDDKACTYVLMDSVKVKTKNNNNCLPDDPTCYQQNDLECATQLGSAPSCYADPAQIAAGKIDCDIDHDCVDELVTGGARSWLDLDGSGGGANDLSDWICNPATVPPVVPHLWAPSENGVATSIFHSVTSCMVGRDAIVPVFNNICNGVPNMLVDPETNAQCTYGPDDDRSIAKSYTNFHIITFALFHITCVQTGRNKAEAETGYDWIEQNKHDCNGHLWAEQAGSIDANDKTIEGYFKINDLGGFGGPGPWFNTGTFTVVLVPVK